MTSASSRAWLDDLAAQGRSHFTTADAVRGLGASLPAAHAVLSRLKRAGRVASPYRGFYVVVPPQYRPLGCLPAELFIDQLMASLDVPYYVGLLSAAAYHGAAHQRPQRLQVVVAASRRPVVCGRVEVDFVARKDMEATPTVVRNTAAGTLRLSTAEATALELVGYADRCGGLDHVATVLSELGEVMDAEALVAAAALCPVVWVQRLGWLLEQAGHGELASALLPHVARRANSPAPLVRSEAVRGAVRDPRWRLVLNADVQPDDL